MAFTSYVQRINTSPSRMEPGTSSILSIKRQQRDPDHSACMISLDATLNKLNDDHVIDWGTSIPKAVSVPLTVSYDYKWSSTVRSCARKVHGDLMNADNHLNYQHIH